MRGARSYINPSTTGPLVSIIPTASLTLPSLLHFHHQPTNSNTIFKLTLLSSTFKMQLSVVFMGLLATLAIAHPSSPVIGSNGATGDGATAEYNSGNSAETTYHTGPSVDQTSQVDKGIIGDGVLNNLNKDGKILTGSLNDLSVLDNNDVSVL
ncbi:uncharacterized protein BP01DRAFT_389368 [Aspergillus saccharolyticus JOP 1030-1]|uniref:Uncharacterized protein n=1 Tax=Aspergillus saccharolyticus JOP 1030-1 TaxID=1450539 RepID=A0A318ZKE5_9EURO|nr:hypothetical protein BP01DRAFT_389368 [Aspergillus saccharolyticus JOP 1030-1]PYH48061.1 hypothetical protein BP01DRAFT_389368 [Aspergillus saccharolyticus JOP 1030-1]